MNKKKIILQSRNWLFRFGQFAFISFLAVWLCPALHAQKAKRVEFFQQINPSIQIVDIKKLDAPNATLRKLKFKDFGNEELGNPITLGLAYQFGWLNNAAHISFIGDIGWNYWHFITQQMDEAENAHHIHSLKPGASLMYHIGNFTASKKKVRGLVSVGANYNWNFNYKSAMTTDNAAINNGLSSVYGIGIEYLNNEIVSIQDNYGRYSGSVEAKFYVACLLKYEHSHYNFFNTDYSLNNVKIFDDWQSKFGTLYLSLIIKIK